MYDTEGFLRIDRLFPEGRMHEIDLELGRYLDQVVATLPSTDVVFEKADGSETPRIRNLWRMEHHSDYFARLAQDPELLHLIAPLVNGNPELMAVELFAKAARVGSAVPYHQDNGYFNLTPPDALTCWIALDDSSLENGCVYYARGSHRQGLLPHKASLVPGNSWGLARVPDPGEYDEVPGVVSRGGAMLHHCCLLHRSEKNLSEHPRRGLLLVYKGAHCEIDAAGMARYQAAAKALQEHMEEHS
jgi:phytanoyl-CoA hydroxylase